ncbi:MAG: alpha/beta hydrolase, partial [Myxococcales bacterium]
AALTQANEAPRLLIVALHPVDRDREYTHAPWFPGRPYGGLEAYAAHVAGPVRDWVDASYPTVPDPRLTAAVGASHGGLAAFYTAARHPGRFGLVGAQSPSFWVGRGDDGSSIRSPLGPSELMHRLGPALRDRAARPTVWIDWGLNGDGGRHGAREMAELLRDDYAYTPGSDLFTFEDPPAGHDEDAWAYRFPAMMRALYGGR